METDIPHPSERTLLADGVRVLSRLVRRAKAVRGNGAADAGELWRDRTRAAKQLARRIGATLVHPLPAAACRGAGRLPSGGVGLRPPGLGASCSVRGGPRLVPACRGCGGGLIRPRGESCTGSGRQPAPRCSGCWRHTRRGCGGPPLGGRPGAPLYGLRRRRRRRARRAEALGAVALRPGAELACQGSALRPRPELPPDRRGRRAGNGAA